MVIMLMLDIHHEGLSIGNLGNVHVPLMQLIHSRWEVLDLVWMDQRFAPDILPCYFRFFKRRHGLDFEELSNRDIEHLSLHYMILCYYHIAMLGNANGLPTIIFGARTTPLMCCWHNKRGIASTACSPNRGMVSLHFLPAACWLELELPSFFSRSRCSFLIWRS